MLQECNAKVGEEVTGFRWQDAEAVMATSSASDGDDGGYSDEALPGSVMKNPG
jgi:hypothetical protein